MVRASAAAKKPEAPAAETPSSPKNVFMVSFRSADPSLDRMVVRCHKGGTGEGADYVSIVRAGKGPCRIEGHWGETKRTVMQVVMGPKDYSCFKDGARRCE